MNDLLVTQLATDALKTALYISGPALLTTLIVGLVISIFQVVTSLQDQSVALIPKIIATMVVLALSMPWMLRHLVSFAVRMFTEFNAFSRALG